MRWLALGYGLLLLGALSAFLAYYAQYHNPFVTQASPFWSAFFLIFLTLLAFVAIIRYFMHL